MKTAILLLTILNIPSFSHANGLCKANVDFVTVPDRDISIATPTEVSWKLDELPHGVAELLEQADPTYTLPGTSREASGFQFDLNGDNVGELLVVIKAWSGSGGFSYMILSKYEDQWRNIGSFQGGFIPLTSKKQFAGTSWRDFVSFSRGGGDIYARTTYSFNGKSYEPAQSIVCARGLIKR